MKNKLNIQWTCAWGVAVTCIWIAVYITNLHFVWDGVYVASYITLFIITCVSFMWITGVEESACEIELERIPDVFRDFCEARGSDYALWLDEARRADPHLDKALVYIEKLTK